MRSGFCAFLLFLCLWALLGIDSKLAGIKADLARLTTAPAVITTQPAEEDGRSLMHLPRTWDIAYGPDSPAAHVSQHPDVDDTFDAPGAGRDPAGGGQ